MSVHSDDCVSHTVWCGGRGSAEGCETPHRPQPSLPLRTVVADCSLFSYKPVALSSTRSVSPFVPPHRTAMSVLPSISTSFWTLHSFSCRCTLCTFVYINNEQPSSDSAQSDCVVTLSHAVTRGVSRSRKSQGCCERIRVVKFSNCYFLWAQTTSTITKSTRV